MSELTDYLDSWKSAIENGEPESKPVRCLINIKTNTMISLVSESIGCYITKDGVVLDGDNIVHLDELDLSGFSEYELSPADLAVTNSDPSDSDAEFTVTLTFNFKDPSQ